MDSTRWERESGNKSEYLHFAFLMISLGFGGVRRDKEEKRGFEKSS